MTLPPAPGTLEAWAWDILHAPFRPTTVLGPVPDAVDPDFVAVRIAAPCRDGLTMLAKAEKSPRPGALREGRARARLVHTFLHHEVQAAELMAWAILAWPEAPLAFRRGLGAIARDELRHMVMYADYLSDLGVTFGEQPVRDWFWERVPRVESPAGFCAVMGMGLEAANLDHTARFAQRLRDVGDTAGARLQEVVAEEELPHVRFGIHWFRRWHPEGDYSTWASLLPRPLSPLLMRGDPLDRVARTRAGFSEDFTEALAGAQVQPLPQAPPCPPSPGS